MAEATLRPLDALNQARGSNVVVELKNNKQLVGKLISFDIHVNVVLEGCEELVDGNVTRKLGTVFIRGDTILFVSSN